MSINFSGLYTSFCQLREFLGGRVFSLFLKSSAVGFFVFAVESSFIWVLQGFMRAVGLVDESKLQLPIWFPSSLGGAVGLLALFGLLRGTAYFLRSYLGGVTNQAFIRLQRSRILEYALFHANQVSTHEVVTVYSDRVTQAGGVLYGVSGLALTFTSSLLLFLLGLKLAPLEMCLGLVLLAIFLFPLKYLNHRIQSAADGLVRESESASRSLIQGIRHFLFLKIYNLVRREVQCGVSSLERYEAQYSKYYLVSSFKFSLPLTVGILVVCVITYVSVAHIHTPAVQLVSFFYIFIRLAQGASDINSTLAETRLQIPGFLQLFEWHKKFLIHSEKAEVQEKEMAPSLVKAFSEKVQNVGVELEVRHMSFGFPGAKPLFQDFSLLVKRGEVLVVQGESGVGKSTLLNLLFGLLNPEKGEILVSGFPVQEIRPLLDRYVAYVGPEPHLITGTVKENLLYGHRDPSQVTDEQIWDALGKAQLSDHIRRLAGGLGEPLQELTQFSTGQKQRLAIARAVLREPLWLVLDEASANLDAGTEEKFIDSLQPLLPRLTTVVISHKPSFNRIATKHFLMKQESAP